METTPCAPVEHLISALFQLDRAETHHDRGAAHAALARAVRESHRGGFSLARLSQLSGMTHDELRSLLD